MASTQVGTGRNDILTGVVRRAFQTIILAGAAIASASAQDAPKPAAAAPAPQTLSATEQAVKDRASGFYALQMEGKFRQAEAFVCEDSKDRFYSSRKRRWRSADIVTVRTEADGKTVLVTTGLGTDQTTPSGIVQVTFPSTTYWRQEEGAWCLHIPEPKGSGVATPFGTMNSSDTTSGTTGRPAGPLKMNPVSLDTVLRGVKVDREELKLNAGGASTDQVVITNTLPGSVEIELIPAAVPGLKLTLSATKLKAKETATLTATFTPSGSAKLPPAEARLVVQPLNQQIPIAIHFSPAPSAAK